MCCKFRLVQNQGRYIASDIVQGHTKNQTQIEYLIDARASRRCEVTHNRFLLVDKNVHFDDKIKLPTRAVMSS